MSIVSSFCKTETRNYIVRTVVRKACANNRTRRVNGSGMKKLQQGAAGTDDDYTNWARVCESFLQRTPVRSPLANQASAQ
jgi:hypothetical protein